MLTDSQTISESFNTSTYFSTLGLDINTKYNGQDSNANTKLLFTSNIFSLFNTPYFETEVIQQIYFIKNDSSCGPDEIPSRFLVLAAEVLATPLKILFNFSFKTGIYPNCLKIPKVIPVYKQSDKNKHW